MMAAVSTIFPPVGEPTPLVELQEKALSILRKELAACTDKSQRALLLHEMARIHERRGDLSAAARDELAATKHAAGFIAPVEGLISIAIRSHSRSNLTKLFERVLKLAKDPDERLRAHLCLTALLLEAGDNSKTLAQINRALDELPSEPTLYLALEAFATKTGDRESFKRAAMGRAAHARSPELRSLLFERAARLHQEAGETREALDFVRLSVDERPTHRALSTWELIATRGKDYAEAGLAASQIASIIRAAQAEPEEAPLYEVPEPELSDVRAFCAQLRSVVYAAHDEDWDTASLRSEEFVETWPNQVLALLTASTLAERTGHPEVRLRCLQSLLELSSSHAGDRAFFASLLWFASSEGTARRLAEAALQESAPHSFGARALSMREALQAASEHAGTDRALLCSRLSEGQNEVFSACGNASRRVAQSLLLIALGDLSKAESLLEDLPDLPFGPARALLLALRNRDPGTCRSETPPFSLERDDRLAQEWSRLRFEFQDTGYVPRKVLDQVTVFEDAPYLRLSFELLDPNLNIGEHLERYADAEPSEEVKRSLLALGVALSTEVSSVRASLQSLDEADDALTIGQLLADHGELAPSILMAAGPRIGDADIHAGWLLRAVRMALREANEPLCQQALSELARVDLPLARAPANWLSAMRVADDPSDRLRYFEDKKLAQLGNLGQQDPSDDPAADRRLEYMWLIHDRKREGFFSWCRGAAQARNLTRAEEVLLGLAASLSPQGLRQAKQSIVSFETVLSDDDDEILLLAGSPDDSELVQLIQSLCNAPPDSDSTTDDVDVLMATWVAAMRCDDPREEARALLRLSLLIGDSALLASVDAQYLDDDDRELRRTSLKEALADALNREETHDASIVAGSTTAELAWTLSEEAEGTDRSTTLSNLAHIIDPEFQDTDSQLALLCAGYQHLMEENFELSVECLEPLLRVLPSDLTLCKGLRLAAERTDRPDLEAQVTCELARHASDSRTASQLWERAGLLYQDRLADPVQAEECFNAALAQNPGSPISFERLYRIARSKKDRPRQLDLIEARLTTADSETLTVELLWEKARYCRLLGRLDQAVSALEQLSGLAPDHLPSIALSAELYLGRGKKHEAAEALGRVALHPDTPAAQRKSAGFFAADLLEHLGRSKEALALLQQLESLGIHSNQSLLRKARSLAKSEDYEAAYEAFVTLNDQQDAVEERKASATILLALQRDHLRQPELLEDAARRVLRDDPLNWDALEVALGVVDDGRRMAFDRDERRRLFEPARRHTVEALRNHPLDASRMRLLARLCFQCENETLERVSLGLLALTGHLDQADEERLISLRNRCPLLPSHAWSRLDLDALSARGQLGAMSKYAETLAPLMAQALEPSLDGLGVSSLMKVDEHGEDETWQQVSAWCTAFGVYPFELFVGGFDGKLIRGLNREVPTLAIGAELSLPLSRKSCARLAAQIQTLRLKSAVLLNQPTATTTAWCEASRCVAEGTTSSTRDPTVNEIARKLGHATGRDERETLKGLLIDLNRARYDVRNLPDATLLGAARAAAVAYGDPSIVRSLGDLLPEDEGRRNTLLSDLIRFALSDQFAALRRRAGLEGV